MEQIKKEDVEFIIIHHSNRIIDCPLFIKIRHKYLRGWDDTGYHFIIGNGIFTKNGKIYKGRPTKFVGAHSYGYNQKSIGICLIGDLDQTKPTFRQYRSLIRLIVILKKQFPIKTILSHNETEGCIKTCPGKLFDITRIRKIL